jgi:hypothetical protein
MRNHRRPSNSFFRDSFVSGHFHEEEVRESVFDLAPFFYFFPNPEFLVLIFLLLLLSSTWKSFSKVWNLLFFLLFLQKCLLCVFPLLSYHQARVGGRFGRSVGRERERVPGVCDGFLLLSDRRTRVKKPKKKNSPEMSWKLKVGDPIVENARSIFVCWPSRKKNCATGWKENE